MDKILIVDLAFLVVFCVWVVLFLFKNRRNLKREGIMYMYRTRLGMQAIENFSKNHSKLLKRIKYFVIVVAFFLMILIILLLATNAYAYLKSPEQVIAATNGAPPVAPLIPYFPQLFGMQSFFPNFYFSYFIIALAIVAIVHEFSHGVFMKTFGVKIKSTGFIFLGPILGAFVEEDKNNFEKKKNSEQMAILGAGVFANLIFAIIFFVGLIVFFNLSYAPSGYIFSGYVQTTINSSEIVGFENFSENLVRINTTDNKYYIPISLYSLILQNESLLENSSLIVYADHPAIRNELKGAIIALDDEKISDAITFQEKISSKIPGQEVQIKTNYLGEIKEYGFVLDEHPLNSSVGFLGISGKRIVYSRNILGKFVGLIQYKDSSIFYQARYNSDVADYFRYLFYWIALINFFVAMFNMLPLGILDGGRFSYLFILSLTKSKAKSEKIYKFILSTVGIIFLLIIFGWIFAKFFN